VLVTGAEGQVGEALRASRPSGVDVVSLARRDLDITDAQAVGAAVARHRPQWIFNAAAYTAVDRAESEPERARRVNATGPETLARAAEATGCRLLQLSTDFVFAGGQPVPYATDSVTGPLNVYGATKLDGEHAVARVLAARALIVRTSWVYAARGTNFVLRMIGLMQTRESLNVVQDQVGGPTWARSLAKCLWALATVHDAQGVHHWCDSGVASWYDFAVAIQEEAHARGMLTRRIPVHPIRSSEYPTAARRPAYSVLDTRATAAAVGWTPEHWRQNLRAMLDELQGARSA